MSRHNFTTNLCFVNETSNIRRVGKIVLGALVGLIAIALIVYAWDYANNQGKVPRGTSVGGVEIGGMSKAAAQKKLQEQLGDIETRPVDVTAGDKHSQLIPKDSGLMIDWAATVDAAGSESKNPVTRLKGIFGTHEVNVVSKVDDSKLNPQLDRIVKELGTDARDGGVALEGGKVKTIDPVKGQMVDRGEVHDRVAERWLDPNGVKVKDQPVDPGINGDVVSAAAKGPAAKAVSGPVKLKGRDNVIGVIPEDRMGEIVTFVPEGNRLTPKLDNDKAKSILQDQLSKTEKQPINAEIRPDGSIVSHVDGTTIDWDTTLKGLQNRIIGDQPRTWDAKYQDEPAKFTTEMAKNAKFDQTIGSFTTSGFSADSGHNIGVIAQKVDGAIVAPGETFSLNKFTGTRSYEQGYVDAGVIENGRPDKAVGGGISQFATTLYNATYFAGMDDVTHTPHSYYISRYPAGREATVFDGAIDLAFKNSSPFPVRIETIKTDNDITVNIKGVKTVNVESIPGPRTNSTEPSVQHVSGDRCTPASGIPGFTTTDTRVIRDLDGKELSRKTTTTRYDPQPIVKCG